MIKDTILRRQNPFLLATLAIAFFSFGRILFLHNMFWDDHCWLHSAYIASNLNEFLNTGFIELNRYVQGIPFYYFFLLHKKLDNPYYIWQLINFTPMILAPCFLFLLVRKLSRSNWLAFFIASSFSVFYLDMTLPIFSNIPHRLAASLNIASFYLALLGVEADLSNSSLMPERKSIVYFILAIGLSFVSNYLFFSGGIVLEPMRLGLMLIFLILTLGQCEKNKTAKIFFWQFLFLFFICAPIAYTKLTELPKGGYTNAYVSDYSFYNNWDLHISYLKMLRLKNWRELMSFQQRQHTSISNLVFVFAAVSTLSFLFFRKLKKEICSLLIDGAKNENSLLLIGVGLLFIPIFLAEFAGQTPNIGVSSRHGADFQFGFAMVIGCLTFKLFKFCCSQKRKISIFFTIMAVFYALGIYLNNVNLDLYFRLSKLETTFWEKFLSRVGEIPKGTDFLFDVELSNPLYTLDIHYDYEPFINILYNSNYKIDQSFRHYKVEDLNNLRTLKINEKLWQRKSWHWGDDQFIPMNTVVVYYRNEKILFNEEIVKEAPNYKYANLANRPVPSFVQLNIDNSERREIWKRLYFY